MKNLRTQPILADLVLVGGGHANIQVMKMFAMQPIGGLRLTLVSDKIHALYSGMIPGFLAGYYDYEQCHFDLPKICQKYGIRFIHQKVIGVDSVRQKILFDDRPELAYDYASINVGIAPKNIFKGNPNVIPVKPISTFVSQWSALKAELNDKKELSQIAVVGAGAAGVELSLILMEQARQNSWNIKVSLFQRSSFLVSKGDPGAHKKLLSALKRHNVDVKLEQEFSRPEDFDKVLLSSQAQAPSWFKTSGLDVEDGFLKVDSHLKVLNCDHLFAAGDCIHFSPRPLKKSGVYAVRQGRVLAVNIRKAILQKSNLKVFKPKKNVLSLIVVGHKEVIAHQDSKSFLSFLPPKILWKLKNEIDLRFMEKYSSMKGEMPEPKTHLSEEKWIENTCGGCGSKIDSSILRSALKKLGLLSINDDAAVTLVAKDKLCLQSIDQFRTFISDPFVFAEIAVHHALSDIYAMGGEPKNLMIGLSLSPATAKIQREEIIQTMGGILKGLSVSGAQLVGGHTNEAAEFSLALSVQGEVSEEQLLKKQNLKIGDHLILTKPLGTGVILAGHMESKVSGLVLSQALEHMRRSNGGALICLKQFAVKNCTDITGFGFAGHLNEMLGDAFGATIDYSILPTMNGAQDLFRQGLRSSISHKNRTSLGIKLPESITDENHPLLFDPQTSGGLLFSIASDKSSDCLIALKKIGFNQATVVGTITNHNMGMTLS